MQIFLLGCCSRTAIGSKAGFSHFHSRWIARAHRQTLIPFFKTFPSPTQLPRAHAPLSQFFPRAGAHCQPHTAINLNSDLYLSGPIKPYGGLLLKTSFPHPHRLSQRAWFSVSVFASPQHTGSLSWAQFHPSALPPAHSWNNSQ